MNMKLVDSVNKEFAFIVDRENLDAEQKKELAGFCMDMVSCETKKELKALIGKSQLSDEVINGVCNA